jgi:3D (Asp-Asp-Asp) domain-containing protein
MSDAENNGWRAAANSWRFLALAILLALGSTGCITSSIRPPSNSRPITATVELTGYCNCGECCNWHRTWFGLGSPVVTSGPDRGKPKRVGYTSSGTEARTGTLAADLSLYPYGTIVYIPDYGFGRVEDTGGAIRGNHMDLWFSTHAEAMQWGKQRRRIKIWLPSRRQ